MEQPKQLNKKTIAIIIGIVILIMVGVLVYLSVRVLTRENPNGPEIKIDNFDQYYADLPQEQEDFVFHNLYIMAENNLSGDASIPANTKAVIRDDSTTLEYNSLTHVYTGNFLVDIPDLQQSYRMYITYSPDKDNPASVDAYPAIAYCVQSDEVIYPDFDCQNPPTNDDPTGQIAKNPLLESLPIEIDYYTGGYGKQVWYEIRGEISKDGQTVKIIISDYTGGNEQAALQRIADEGFDSADYDIEYVDLSARDGRAEY